MPTLRPITSHADILTYHRFRYEIYANSLQRGFLAEQAGSDTDEYDANALHLGWYEGDELVGCVRLLSPIKGGDPLHLFKDLSDPGLRERAQLLLWERRRNGGTICEVSRLCLAPEKRSLATTRRFVLAIIATAHRYGRNDCLFTCDKQHASFWQRMGFTVPEAFDGYARIRSTRPGYLMQGSYRELLAKNRAELQEVGLLMAAPLLAAA